MAPGLFDVVAFIASIASLILAGGAIWLSIVFFKMSSEASKATNEAAKGISASVERLEKIFDKLYSDTFSMMRDTVADMRKHMWPAEGTEPDKTAEEVEKKADEKVNELRRLMEQQLSEILQRQRIADDRVASLRGEMARLLERAIVSSRQAETEAREETIREYIMREIRLIRRHRPTVQVNDLVNRLRDRFPLTRIVEELEKLRAEGLLLLSSERIMPETEVLMRADMEGKDRRPSS